ncbi:MAG TPA: hypothetical protein VLJ11_21070, partial [Bryobacteraceae bacterium]|nr:hypothetical protein [Bryobacteraceae bacterium]
FRRARAGGVQGVLPVHLGAGERRGGFGSGGRLRLVPGFTGLFAGLVFSLASQLAGGHGGSGASCTAA